MSPIGCKGRLQSRAAPEDTKEFELRVLRAVSKELTSGPSLVRSYAHLDGGICEAKQMGLWEAMRTFVPGLYEQQPLAATKLASGRRNICVLVSRKSKIDEEDD